MKRKIFSKLLMGAFLIASVSMFVSCKDYDDDISANTKAIEAVQSDLQAKVSALQSALDAAKSEFNTKLADYATKAALATTDGNVATNASGIKTNADAIAKTNDAVNALKDALTAYATVEQLNAAVQQAQATLETAISGKASQEDLKALETALNAQIATINANLPELVAPFAKSDDVKDWIAAATKNLADQESVNNALATALASYAKSADLEAYAKTADLAAYVKEGDMQKALQELQASLNAYAKADDLKNYLTTSAFDTFKNSLNDVARKSDIKDWVTTDALKAAGYATAADLKDLSDKFTALSKNISTLNDPEKVSAIITEVGKIATIEGDLKTINNTLKGAQTADQVKDAIKEANKTIEANITKLNILTVGLNKRLTSIVLKPSFYWEGLEAIEVPYLTAPVFQEKSGYTFDYTIKTAPIGKETVKVKVDKVMWWVASDGTLYANAEDNKTWPTAGGRSLIVADGAALLPKGKEMRIREIADGGVAYYHLNPAKADIEGASITFYDRLAETYTRGETNLGIKAKEATYKAGGLNKWDGQILEVPFTLNYKNLQTYFDNWTSSKTYTPDPAWDTDKDGSFGNNWYAETDKKKENALGKLPYVSLEIEVPAVKDADGNEISPVINVNSDYAVLVPGKYEIVALADNAPDETLATIYDNKTFVKDHTGKIRANHLYESVGYTPGSNDYDCYGAIPMPATHQVKYNGTIDLSKFVETHFDYTSFAKYGTSTTDQKMDDALLKALGLHYEYTIIDYTMGDNVTGESKHIVKVDASGNETTDKKASIFAPRSVDKEKGETIHNEVATREAVDREPLIRVDLVSEATNEIIRYGYIKLRIVDTEIKDIAVSVDLGEMYMNCGEEGRMTWYQVENQILKELNLTKKEFERIYYLDTENGVKYVPGDGDYTAEDGTSVKSGKLYADAATNKWWAKRYYFDTKANEYKAAVEASATEAAAEAKLDKYTADNNWFGRVWYTPHDNSTDPHAWDEATNVLIWNLTDNANAGGMTKKEYTKLRDIAGAKYETKGLSKNKISTVVRFIHKATGNNVWVTLFYDVEKLHFAYADINHRVLDHWYSFTKGYANSPEKTDTIEVYANVPTPAEHSKTTLKYYFTKAEMDAASFTGLKVDEFDKELTEYWLEQKIVVDYHDAKHFSKFTKDGNTHTKFQFRLPKKGENADFDAAKDGSWEVYGVSTKADGKHNVWTVKLNDAKDEILAVKFNGTTLATPRVICKLSATGKIECLSRRQQGSCS